MDCIDTFINLANNMEIRKTGNRPFNNLFKVDKFTKIQYIYIHKSSQTNWLIKVNYPILPKKNKKEKKSGNLLIKKKKVKLVCDVS